MHDVAERLAERLLSADEARDDLSRAFEARLADSADARWANGRAGKRD